MYEILDKEGNPLSKATIFLGNGKSYTKDNLYLMDKKILEKLLENKRIRKIEVEKKVEKKVKKEKPKPKKEIINNEKK